MEPVSDIDKAKFKELFEKGLLTARPPEVWLPKWLDKRLPHISIEGEAEK